MNNFGTVKLWEDCDECETESQKIDHLAKLVIERQSDKDILTSVEVCKLLNIRLNTLDNYCSQGLIAYSKTQRKRYFFRSDIYNYLNKYRVNSRY